MSARRAPKKGVGSGTVLLWLIMFAAIGGAVAEFIGPFKGWVEPASEQARDLVTKVMRKMGKSKEDVEVKKKPVIAPKPKTEAARSGLVIPIVDAVKTAAMSRLPRTGECTPVYLAMTEAPLPKKKPVVRSDDGIPAVVENKPEVIEPKKGTIEIKNSEDEFEAMYEKFLAEERKAGQPKPEVGKTYRYRLKNGKLVTGRLIVLSRNLAVLKTSSTTDVSLSPDKVTEQSALRLFPEMFARKRALARLDKEMEKRFPKVAAAEPVVATHTPPVHVPDAPERTNPVKPTEPHPIIPTRPKPKRLEKYDPSYAKTPSHLGKPVKNFGNWLQYQSNRAGGAIATKLYAKDYGKEAVLYAQMSRFFQVQKRSTRSLVADQLWHMWARQCRETGTVRSIRYAHIVLVDSKGRIIGGSRVNDAEDIWVKR